VYTALAVNTEGERDILGLWMGDGGEGAKFWHQVLTELKNRGVADVCIVCCDGLKGLPESISSVWPAAIIQTCVLHLVRNTFRYASRADWEKLAKDLRPIYTAANEAQAKERFEELVKRSRSVSSARSPRASKCRASSSARTSGIGITRMLAGVLGGPRNGSPLTVKSC
jgi:transposase-like protein